MPIFPLLLACLASLAAGVGLGGWLGLRRGKRSLGIALRRAHELVRGSAHGLRNPLSGISLVAELAEEEEDLERLRGHVRTIRTQADVMTQLLSRFVDASAIETGQLARRSERVDLRALAQDLLGSLALRARDKAQSLELAPGEDLAVHADRGAVAKILEQYLRNALAFSSPGAKVRVRLEEAPGVVRVRVEDEGPGLSEEDWPRLFQRFARLSARPTGDEVTSGLGLYTARVLAESMGGRVWAENREGGGACFGLELKR